METNLRVFSTAYPDGYIIRWPEGMPKPKLDDMTGLLKQSLFNAITPRHKQKLKLVKRQSA